MEMLLHYCWKHRLLPAGELATTDGHRVEIIDPGLHNADAGPDFFNAKIRLDGMVWTGNVELHDKSSDWFAHHHDRDPRYDNVILHVCAIVDGEAVTHSGRRPPQLQLDVPPTVKGNYDELQHEDRYPPCHGIVPQLPALTVHSWMNALQVERLEQKTRDIERRLMLTDNSWESACFVTLARSFAFGKNTDAMEHWALSLSMSTLAHQRDDLLQTESIFMGQAGLLEAESMAERNRAAAMADGYFNTLRREYAYLRRKYGLRPIDHREWNFLRLRPQNFPYIRLSQLVTLYSGRRVGMSALLDCHEADEARRLLHAQVTPYWQTHYVFGQQSAPSAKRLSSSSIDLVMLNAVVPLLFAYGRHHDDEALCDRAMGFMEQLKAERNSIIDMWDECGLHASSAADTQALLQLKKEYCDHHECLRCRIGYEYLKGRKQTNDQR